MELTELKRAEIVYWGMMVRCYNKRAPSYKDFGGRGLTVCDKWRTSFERFVEDMGYPPLDSTIHLKLGVAIYCLENCGWKPRKSAKKLITHDGKSLPATKWAEITGVPSTLIEARMKQIGWSAERALTTPLTPKRRVLTFNGETRPLAEWAIITGMEATTLASRLKTGWTVEEALTVALFKRRERKAG